LGFTTSILNSQNNFFKIPIIKGCGPKVIDAIDYYVSYVFGFGVVVVLLEIAATILSGILVYNFIKISHFIRLKSLKSAETTHLIQRYEWNALIYFYRMQFYTIFVNIVVSSNII
jgi:hypothetical protein